MASIVTSRLTPGHLRFNHRKIEMSPVRPVSSTRVHSFIAAIGWIPYIDLTAELPADFGKYDWNVRAAKIVQPFKALFLSGNVCVEHSPDNPNSQTIDRDSLIALCRSKNFRLAIAVENIEAYWDGDGNPTAVEFDTLFAPGYTLVRAPLMPPKFTFGLDSDVPTAEMGTRPLPNGLELYFMFAVRLGKLANLVGRVITGGNAAPRVWGVVSCVISKGSAEVNFTGTSIPSQSGYRDGVRVNFHDMLLCTSAEIREFVEAGDNALAPEWTEDERWFTVQTEVAAL